MFGSIMDIIAKYRPAQDMRHEGSKTLRYRILILTSETIVVALSLTVSAADIGQMAAGIELATVLFVSVNPPMPSPTFVVAMKEIRLLS